MIATDSLLYRLPNEILLYILSLLPTNELAPLTLVSHRLHAVILRLWHARLLALSTLISEPSIEDDKGYSLLLECFHPSEKLTAPPLDCIYLGVPGLSDCLDGDHIDGKISGLKELYCTFKPQRRGSRSSRGIPGDIPGSRTHPSSSAAAQEEWRKQREEECVKQVLSLDGHELFSQLVAVTNLVRLGPRQGIFRAFVEVQDGFVRVWKHWLAERARVDKDSVQPTLSEGLIEDQKVVVLAATSSKGKETQHVSLEAEVQPHPPLQDDPQMLWLDNDQNVGLRVRVQELKWHRHAPVLMHADEEQAVQYQLSYEQLYIRANHILTTLESTALDTLKDSGKAVVFGNFRS